MQGIGRIIEGLTLGLPGVYRMPQARARALPATPMDVTGFVGVAERGPAWQPEPDVGEPEDWQLVRPGRPLRRSVPVAVESFDEYRRTFGTGSGGGLMTDAVRAYFEQGARRAWIVRLHPNRAALQSLFTDCASAELKDCVDLGPLVFHARNPGTWGERISVTLRFDRSRLEPTDEPGLAADELAFDSAIQLDPGATLLIDGTRLVRVTEVASRARARIPGSVRRARLSAPVAASPARVELVVADLSLTDGELTQESFTGLGLDPVHPAWMASVLAQASRLVWPDPAWADQPLMPLLPRIGLDHPLRLVGGSDAGNAALVPEDNFDGTWTLSDDPTDRSLSGLQAFLAVEEISQVCLPDLYHPDQAKAVLPILPRPAQGAAFRDCGLTTAEQQEQAPVVPGLLIDPTTAAGRTRITELQKAIVDVCEGTGRFIGLIDAPPGLSARQITQWRGAFASPWIAVYAPWCLMVRRDNYDTPLTRVPPSAVAAGIIAASERAFGVPRGPANWLAAEIVALSDIQPADSLGPMHQAGVNLFTPDADGIRLQGARTTSLDLYDRQLSVRRMLLRLGRMLREEMQWAVFEPSNPVLWENITALLDIVLREEWRRGAFAGPTPETSYFIAVDRSQARLDRGELVVSVGVALVEPMEFVVLRLTRLDDGTFNLEAEA